MPDDKPRGREGRLRCLPHAPLWTEQLTLRCQGAAFLRSFTALSGERRVRQSSLTVWSRRGHTVSTHPPPVTSGLASCFVAAIIVSPSVWFLPPFILVFASGWLEVSSKMDVISGQADSVNHDERTRDTCTLSRMWRINLAKWWSIISVWL